MKKLIIIIVCIFAGIMLYPKISSNRATDDISEQNTRVLTVKGRVNNNLSIMDQSIYELVSLESKNKSYYVLVKGDSPSIGEIRDVRLIKYDLFVLNGHRMTIYIENTENRWLPF